MHRNVSSAGSVLILHYLSSTFFTKQFKLDIMAVSTLTKVTAGFFSFFFVQCFLCPQFLMDQNFVGLELDDMHKFFLRQMGMFGFGLLYFMLTVDSDKYLPFQTVFLTLFLLNGPGYAQRKFPSLDSCRLFSLTF